MGFLRRRALRAEIDVPRHGWWSKSGETGQVGQNQVFQPDINNRQTLANMVEYGPPAVRTISLSLGWDEGLPGNQDVNFSIIADLILGAGGTTHNVQVDWKNGVEIPFLCNTVQVNAIYGSVFNFKAFKPPTDLILRIAVGWGNTYTEGKRLTLSKGFILNAIVLPVFSGLYSIPNYATKLRLIQSYGQYGAIWDVLNTVRFHGNMAGTAPLGEWVGDKNLFTLDGIPIPAGARAVEIESNHPLGFGGIFEFELGL